MKEILIAKLTLDTFNRNKIPPLVIPQHDYGARYIRVRITDQGKSVSVTSGSVVSIIAKRMADGQSAAFLGSVNADGSVLVPVTQWMLDAPSDNVDCHVAVTGTGYQYSTTSFVISPQERENPSYLEEDDPRVNIVEEALIKVVEEADRAEEQADLAQSAASTAASDAKEAARQEVEQLVGQLGIVQTLGNSRMAVVSQAVTTGLYNRNAKRIANLEHGFNEQFETDSSVAYVKDVPENALPYAEVKKVGGMTRKCANLWDEQWEVGQLDANSGGLLSGTTRIRSKNYIPLDGETTYRFSYDNNSNVFCCYDENYAFLGTKYQRSKTFTTLPNTRYVRFMLHPDYGATYKNDIMLNEGSTALPYEPYFEGLRDAKTTEMKSVGANLLTNEKTSSTISGVTFTVNSDQSVTLHGTATALIYYSICEIALGAGTYTLSGVKSNSNIGGSLYEDNHGLAASSANTPISSFTITETKVCRFYISVLSGRTVDEIIYPMLNKGTTAKPYTPYVEHTLPIPEAVRPANGINENVYDFIEWAEDGSVKSHKMVEKVVFDGSADEAWNFKSGRDNAYAPVTALGTARKPIFANKQGIDAIWLNYGYPKNIQYGHSGTPLPYFASIEEFRAWLSQNPLEIVYELAEPIVTDISDLITADNLIGVEGNGTLTFKNAYEYSVPSEVEYQLEV